MKKLILLLTLCASVIFAQLKNPNLEKKFDSVVLQEINIVMLEKQKGNSPDNIKIKKLSKYRNIGLDEKFRVLVRIRVTDSSVNSRIISLGGEVKYTSHNDLYVWIPIDQVEKVAELDGVLSIGSKGTARSRSEVISEGVALHRTNIANSTFATYGSNVKVGVISNGMNYWTNSRDNGDLPQTVYAVDNTNNITNYPGSEGTAMMEIIHDIAPYSELWFGGINQNDTPLDFANRVTHLKQNGCKIIVDDLFFPNGYSFFQENEISTSILQFTQNNNGCYISAVGNEHGQIYSGVNYTVDTDNFIKFSSSTKELTFTTNYNGTAEIFFQWADNWYYPVRDYDLYVYDSNNNILLTQEHRSPNFPPEEWGEVNVTQGATYKIKIKWYDYNISLAAREIKVLVLGDDITMPLASTEKEVFGHLITNEVIGVAATEASTHTAVESFSSRGPAIVYSSTSGTYISNQQPKITAADGVQTFVGQNGNFSNPFYGTSAAAPHLAGIAAIYYSLFPDDSYTDFLNNLKAGAIAFDGGNSQTWNYKSGYGLADAYNAIDLRMPNGVNVAQIDTAGQSFGTAAIYYLGAWQYKNPNENTQIQPSSGWRFKASQDFKTGTYLKYNHWKKDNTLISDRLNHVNTTISTGEERLKAYFLPAYLSSIQNSLEGVSTLNSGTIEFKDPWLIDYYESPYGTRNQGTSAPYKSRTSPFSPDYTTSYSGDVYKGVLFNQGGTGFTPPYYSVRTQSTQTINGYTSYFQNWSTTNATLQSAGALTTGIVFTGINAVITANFKGHLISNATTGFSSNSQRKVVRTDNDQFHMVYESMNQVWYTRSTDGGSTWLQEQKVDYLGANCKSASIAQSNDGLNKVYVVYQRDAVAADNYPKIILTEFQNGSRTLYADVYTLSSYSYDSKPVTAALNNTVCVVFKPSSTSALSEKNFYYSGSWSAHSDFQVNNTTSNSSNPSIASDVQKYFLAYQNGITEIKYLEFFRGVNDILSTYEESIITTGSPYTNNIDPSISSHEGDPLISWSGYSGSIPTAIVKRRVSGTWSNFNSFASGSVRSTNNSSRDAGTDGSIIAWGNIYYEHKFVKLLNGVYSSITNIPETAGNGQIQLSNGYDFNNIKSVVLKQPLSGIYEVKPLPFNFSTLQKVSGNALSNYGRMAIVQKEKKNFVYYLGGIKVDGENIKFQPFTDTSKIKDSKMISEVISSEYFHLTSKSTLVLGNLYYAFENDKYKELKDNDAAFSIELVNVNGNTVKGEFNASKYEFSKITDDESMYKIDCGKIEEGTYYLRVKCNVNGVASYYINDMKSEDTPELNKKSYEEIKIMGGVIPNDYQLGNNYPNPFNPSTVISYSIPLQEYITLKVYDVLGKEVATLVDGIKSAGNYKATFDASKLSSGVYLYILKAGKFTQTNKMLLMK